jgi:hypothetical protein
MRKANEHQRGVAKSEAKKNFNAVKEILDREYNDDLTSKAILLMVVCEFSELLNDALQSVVKSDVNEAVEVEQASKVTRVLKECLNILIDGCEKVIRTPRGPAAAPAEPAAA